MKKLYAIFVAVLVASFFTANFVDAQSVADFYKGRDVKIVIGGSLGGSFGLYSQLAAKHIKKHIPGKPSVIVQSMPGAGGLKALNYTYNAAPKDGSVITVPHAQVLFETLLNEKARFNAQKYNWLGRFVNIDFVGLASKNSGIKSLDDAKRKEVTTGATGVRNETALGAALYNRFVGTKFKVIAGYKGTRRIFQALEQGEVDAICSSWVTAKVIHGAKIDSGEYIPFYTVALERNPALPNIPTITEFGRTEDDKVFLQIYASMGYIGRSLAAPPGVPQDRVIALREAFDKTIKDPEFLAEIKERNIMFNPLSGEKMSTYINKFMKTPPEKIAASRNIYQGILDDIKK